MSRCFPFPPPGYEKKARPDGDANILIKEKHKEKRHKKDKKDKEKKEKKEKKDKERSGEKNGEKKDKKRKHKDKDKNKEKEEKKDSEDKKIVSSSSHRNGEKLGPIGVQVDQIQTQQGRFLLQLEKGVGNRNRPREIWSLDKSSAKELSVKSSGQELDGNHEIFVEGNQKFKDNSVENRTPNGQRLNIGKHLENGSLFNILSKEQKIVEGAVCQEEKVLEKRKERKDKNKHKNNEGRGDKHKDGDRERKSKSKDKKEKKEKMKEEKVKEASTPVQSKLIENGNNSVDIQNDRGSYLFKGNNLNNGSLGKRKEPEMNGFVHGNGSPINKLPRPLSSSKVKQNGSRNDAANPGIQFAMEREAAEAKQKLDAKASCSSSVSENGTKLDSRQPANNYAPERQQDVNNHHHKASESLSPLQHSLGIGRKLEPYQTALNFASEEQGMVTDHKLNKKVLFPQPMAGNGRKLESSGPSTFSSAERKEAVSKPKFDDQGTRINGLGLRKPDACSMRPSPVADQLKETVETHLKPPHPDAKYLTEILTVPKVDWSGIDDQSWLFAREVHGGKKPKIESTKLEESKKVWAEALQLESADVTALPYVIPY